MLSRLSGGYNRFQANEELSGYNKRWMDGEARQTSLDRCGQPIGGLCFLKKNAKRVNLYLNSLALIGLEILINHSRVHNRYEI